MANDTFLPLMKVSLALNKVENLTVLQSEDPGWFLARDFRFTSCATQVFLITFASDCDTHIKGLSYTFRGKGVTSDAEPLPADGTGAEAILRGKYGTVFTAANLQCGTNASQNTAVELAQLMSRTAESLSVLRKEDLLTTLASVGHRQSATLWKPQLISKIMELQPGFLDRTVHLWKQQADNVTEKDQALE